MGNKKQERLAAKAQKLAEAQLHARDVEQEGTAVETETEEELPVGGMSDGDIDGEQGLSQPTTETEAVKADPNAESKAKAIENRKAKQETSTKELLAKYPHVIEVTQMGPSGPTRVRIRCTDPQTKQGPDNKAVSVCEKTREIAVQDLFQVTRCAPCQDRVVRKARRQRQAKKDKSLRAAAREMKGGM